MTILTGRTGALLALLVLAWMGSTPASAVELPSGTEIPMERFGPADAKTRVLWLPSEYGLRPRSMVVAEGLAERGMEVWVADLHTAYFLAVGRTSLNGVPVEDVAELIEVAKAGTERLVLFVANRAAGIGLHAARLWQQAHPEEKLGGIILLHPNLYVRTPDAGEEPEYLPIASLTNQPIYLFQPELSAKRWHLNTLREQLQQGGSDVFIEPLKEVSDGFIARPDFTEPEVQETQRMAARIERAIKMLKPFSRKARPVRGSLEGKRTEVVANLETTLKPVAGTPAPPALELKDLQGRTHRLSDYRGKVVLVNFWATWCPPCVKEIPSLGRLYDRLRERGFEVLAVDVGETVEQVQTFMAERPVDFPVLVDPEGTTVQPWRISAFPSNFVVGTDGRIQLSYYGALEWDAEEVASKIEALLPAASP